MTASGVGTFVGSYSDTPDGSTIGRGAFFVDAAGKPTPLIVTGDVVGGTGGLVVDNANPGFGGGLSRDGTFYAYDVDTTASSLADNVVVVNDNAAVAGSGILREGDAIDPAVGGLAGEAWDNFDVVKINEAGTLLVSGDTAGSFATDEFLFLGDEIVLREGDAIGGGVVTGSVEWADLNESGDWAAVWDADFGQGSVEVLIVNGEVVLSEGDMVDTNGDGVIDGSDAGFLQNFTGLRNVAIGERVGGVLDVYFTADIDAFNTGTTQDDVESAFRLSVVIPEPTSLALVGMGGLTLLRRRR